MKNELVSDFRKRCGDLSDEIHEYFKDVRERGASEPDLKYLMGLMDDINLLNTVGKNNLSYGQTRLEEIEKSFIGEKILIDVELHEAERLREEEELRAQQAVKEDDKKVYDAESYEPNETTKSKAGEVFFKVVVFLGSLSAMAALGVGIHNHSHLKSLTKEATVEQTEDELTDEEKRNLMDAADNENKENETTESNTENVEEKKELVLGEYGTFTDLTSEEQVHARAQYLFDTYYGAIEGNIDDEKLSKMFAEHKNHITVEGIENVIRSMNGLPRVNEDGEYYVTANMSDQILNEAAFYLFGVPSAVYDSNGYKVYVNIPAHLFVPDNTELSRFLAGYDEAYAEFSRSYNKGDGEATYKASQVIAEKMYYEWHLDGIFGDQNPYLLNPEQLKLAKMASVDKWVNYVYEYEQDAQTAVCVPVCIDYNTKELTELKGDEIHQALTYDLWQDTVAISAGMLDEVQQSKKDHGVRYENQIFTDYLMNEINYQYENNYKGKTVSDGQSLKLN